MSTYIPSLLFSLLFVTTLPSLTTAQAPSLNITALSATNSSSILECWSLLNPATVFASAANYPLGSASDDVAMIWSTIPPRTVVGFHNSPRGQLTIVLSGLVHIIVNSSSSTEKKVEVWIPGGRYGMLVAADTIDVSMYGHYAEFPSDAATVLVQVPFAGGTLPKHEVLYEGPCGMEELIG